MEKRKASELSMNDVLNSIPRVAQVEIGVVPLRHDGTKMHFGRSASLDEQQLASAQARLSAVYDKPFTFVAVPDKVLNDFLAMDYSTISAEELSARLGTVQANTEGAVAELVDKILSAAVNLRASDIHVEPTADKLLIRIRVDGMLEDLVRLPQSLAGPLVSRLKVQAQMNIVERRRPQDGQFSSKVGSEEFDIRVATIATLYGEKAELRLLYTTRAVQDLGELGISPTSYDRYKRMIQSQNGLIIASGPTGSGKTTTLQSTLRVLNTPDRNVSTIEDPVEYIVPGVNHVPVIEEIGIGFAEQLRALLRQDPDIILVGESRDSETARISFQAAMAGRLVLTSIHASDAVSTIHRLFQMDVEPHLVAAALRGIVAQRLVRKNCDYCTTSYKATNSEKLLLGFGAEVELKLARGVGCSLCRGSGFLDRIGVYQILPISDKMRDLIATRPDMATLNDLAKKEGVKSLAAEAYELAIRGLTTIEEVSRLVGSDV
ncbi:MAG: GspE/PulE family protein [Actinomycetota bacterium]